jgi:hypothetical protein
MALGPPLSREIRAQIYFLFLRPKQILFILAVDNDMNLFILVRDRLVAGREINDTQPRMTETDALIGGQPCALAVRTAVAKAVRGVLQPPR